MTPAELRAQIRATKAGTYLNASASSPLPESVSEKVHAQVEEMTERGDVGFGRWLAQKEETRRRLAILFDCEAVDLAFVPSTSFGIHAAASFLRARGVQEVLTLAQEFPSTTIPLLHAGLRLRVVKPNPQGIYGLNDIESALGPHTKAVALSQVQFSSGFLMDTGAVGKLCQDKGLYFVLNACQALGQTPVSAKKSQAHFICGTSHKWLMGGYGAGLCYVQPGLYEETPPAWAGWLSVANPMAMDPFFGSESKEEPSHILRKGLQLKKSAQALEAGSHPWEPIVGLGASTQLLLGIGIEEVAAHNADLQKILREQLRALGFSPNAPDDKVAGICTVRVEGKPEDAARALAKEKVWVSPRGGGIRFATHAYNAAEDIENLVEVLQRLDIRPE